MRSYRLDDLVVHVDSDDSNIRDAVDRLLESLGFRLSNDEPGPKGLTLRLAAPSVGAAAAEKRLARPVADEIRARRDGSWIQLECDRHTLNLDSAAGIGEGVIPSQPSHVREDLLIYGLLILVGQRGYFGLHASGVIRNGIGQLLVGDRGSGKSTHTYGLVRRGWEYLADDAVFLRSRNERVEALALRRDLFLDPALARSFPEVDERGDLDPSVGKRRLVMRELYPEAQAERCVPQVLFFPEITTDMKSRVEPLERTQALPRLIAQSLVLGLDAEAIPLHFDVVSQLVSQAESFRILAGQDLKEDPQRVADLLGDIA